MLRPAAAKRHRRRGGACAITPSCITNAVVVAALTVSTLMLVQLASRQRAPGRRQPALEAFEEEDPGEADDLMMEDEDEFLMKNKGLPGFKEMRANQHRWKASRTRTQRNASMAYPPLEGLPVFIKEGSRRLRKEDIFVTQANYDKLMAGYKDDTMVSKSGRPNEHLKQNWLLPKRSFPDAESEDIMEGAVLKECAVVGSSGALLNTSLGGAIDTHDFVLRINQAPTNKKFHRHVGSKTSMRLLNTRWTNKYSDMRFLEGAKDAPESSGQALPLEENSILVVTRAKPKHYDEMVQVLRAMRDDIRVLYLSSRVVSEARRLLVSYRIRLDNQHLGPYFGGSTPSTGYLGLFMMLQMCEKVTVYGFGLDSEDGRMQKYHYFELFTKAAKKNEMNPTHSFDAERDLMRAMAKEGVIQYCGYEPHNRKHNKRCGAVERAGGPRPARSGAYTVHEVDLEAEEGMDEAGGRAGEAHKEPPWG